MNDYARGALEALAWVRSITTGIEGKKERWEILKKEVESAQNDIMSGIAIDFRQRLSLGI